MRIVRKFINEKFTEDSDPISDMGIGKKAQILKAIEGIGFNEKNIIFHDDLSFFSNENLRRDNIGLYDIQQKYFPEAKAKLMKSIKETDEPIESIIDEAKKDGLEKDEILFIIQYTLSKIVSWDDKRHKTQEEDFQRAHIYIQKIGRSRKQKYEEEKNNIYVFIGFMDKVPVTINGKKYYEDKFNTETLVKIDKYNYDELKQISAMKIRARFQYSNNDESGVYMVTIPKDLMDEDRYQKIPDHLYDLIVKYKRSI